MRKKMSEITFLCPSCLVMHPNTGTLNTLADIAFSMPDDFYNEINKQLITLNDKITSHAQEDTTLAKVLSKDDRFKCLTMTEIRNTAYMKSELVTDNMIQGTLTLTKAWLVEKLQQLNIKDFDLSKMPDVALLNRPCEFHFVEASDGTMLPGWIRNSNKVVVGSERRCTKCGRLLYPDTGSAPEIRILLQGNARAAKTSCIIAAVGWLQKMSKEYDGIVDVILPDRSNAANSDTYRNRIYEELDRYRNGYKVIKTEGNQAIPRIFSTLISVNGIKSVLTFVDMPGEFFEDIVNGKEELLLQYPLAYKYSHALWTCMQYEVMAFRKLNGEALRKMEENTALTPAMLEKIQDKYKSRINDIRVDMRDHNIPIPRHAVVLTKTDALADEKPDLEDKFIFSTDPENLKDCVACLVDKENKTSQLILEEAALHRISSSVYQFFDDSQSDHLLPSESMCSLMKDFSDRLCYFATSAYGHPAVEKKASSAATPPQPYHPHLPLLWTLALCDRLPIRYNVTYRKRLSFLKRLFSNTQYITCGTSETITPFSKADDACKNNLLGNRRDYEYHFAPLRRGGK